MEVRRQDPLVLRAIFQHQAPHHLSNVPPWSQNKLKTIPKFLPRPFRIEISPQSEAEIPWTSIQNRSNIHHTCMSGFNFSFSWLFHNFFFQRPKHRTLKIIKKPMFFCMFLYLRQLLTIDSLIFETCLQKSSFWHSNAPKIHPMLFRSEILQNAERGERSEPCEAYAEQCYTWQRYLTPDGERFNPTHSHCPTQLIYQKTLREVYAEQHCTW